MEKKVMDKIGYLDESYYYCMDYEYWVRIFFNFKMGHLNNPLAKFRIHNESKTGNNPIELYNEYRRVVSTLFYSISSETKAQLKKINIYNNPLDQKYPIDNPPSIPILNEMINSYIYQCAIQEYTKGNIANTNNLLKNSSWSSGKIAKMALLLKNNLGIRKIKK
ncbi:MAG: hypothetical protein R2753_17825 [Chitinophagales bacterium]